MSARQLHRGVAVHVGQQAQAETLRVGRIREAVHRQRGLRGVEDLPHPLVQLVVGDGAPEGRLAVCHRLKVWQGVDQKRHIFVQKDGKDIPLDERTGTKRLITMAGESAEA